MGWVAGHFHPGILLLKLGWVAHERYSLVKEDTFFIVAEHSRMKSFPLRLGYLRLSRREPDMTQIHPPLAVEGNAAHRREICCLDGLFI